jgi:dTDP-4-amino-4,6-dideoxygalactose transaminase
VLSFYSGKEERMMKIPFSPPDISQAEIDEVVDTLKSGWITTGPKTKLFEKRIAEFCGTKKVVCLNSATAAMEMTLRLLGIGEGDEVITSAYTYTASASVIHHVGAKIVLVDTGKDSFHLDYDAIADAITEKTKAIIPVDIAGVMCDYDKIFEAVRSRKASFKPANKLQEMLGRVIVLADGAHSIGAKYKNQLSGSVADFTCFSFHAVKNLTTAEGGAVTWRAIDGIDNEELYKEYMLLTLHGQSKDALAKTNLGAWEYDIVAPNYKCNMTDIMASIGLVQLERYPELLKKRKELIAQYDKAFEQSGIEVLKHFDGVNESSGHLYLTRVPVDTEEERNEVIEKMAEAGIATNVHYKPLPMHTAYKNLGFNINNYPNTYEMYSNEVTLPLYSMLGEQEIEYILLGVFQCLDLNE